MKLVKGKKAVEYLAGNGETIVDATYISLKGFWHPALLVFEQKDFKGTASKEREKK